MRPHRNTDLPFAIILAACTVGVVGVGCGGSKKTMHATPTYTTGQVRRAFVFPPGVYQHDATLKIEQGARSDGKSEFKEHRLRGVVQLQSDFIRVVALSPFGTTVFSITDDRTRGVVHAEIYVDRLKPHKEKLLQYYGTVKKLLTLENRSDVRPGASLQMDSTTVFVFGDFDKHRIPESVRIQAEHFNVHIQITGYDI